MIKQNNLQSPLQAYSYIYVWLTAEYSDTSTSLDA